MSKTILASLWMHSSAGRRHLAGIYRYISSRGRDWDVQLVKTDYELTCERMAELIKQGLDGIISVYPFDKTAQRLIQSANIPIVAIDTRAIPNATTILSDDEAVGRLAATHLMEFGNFRSFAYIPSKAAKRWSYLRMKGFALQLAKQRRRAILKGNRTTPVQWLKRLKKPAAVFCASDAIAVDILHAAAEAKLNVPKDIALLGVDDDELVCDNVRPTLSSVRPGHEPCGYAAAEILDRILRHRKVKDTLIPPIGVTNRASIAPCLPATTLVDRVLSAIDNHATDGWSVDDIAKAVGASRRLVSLRFAELQGTSVHAALVNRRLSEVERLLHVPYLKIKDISRKAGFGNANALKGLFKKRYGMTMREFRQAEERTSDRKDGKRKPRH